MNLIFEDDDLPVFQSIFVYLKMATASGDHDQAEFSKMRDESLRKTLNEFYNNETLADFELRVPKTGDETEDKVFKIIIFDWVFFAIGNLWPTKILLQHSFN